MSESIKIITTVFCCEQCPYFKFSMYITIPHRCTTFGFDLDDKECSKKIDTRCQLSKEETNLPRNRM